MHTAGQSLHAIGTPLEEIRCSKCNKKLAEAEYRRLAIKCPRCGTMNTLKAAEPQHRANSAQKEKIGDHDP